jgi:hypothetical protein
MGEYHQGKVDNPPVKGVVAVAGTAITVPAIAAMPPVMGAYHQGKVDNHLVKGVGVVIMTMTTTMAVRTTINP